MSNDNGKDTEKQKYPQLIFKAELVKKDDKLIVEFVRKTVHIPTLDYVVNQLHYDIIELRAQEKTKQEMSKLKIITKGPMMSLNQFLNRKRR